jgi:betaine-aldehyde dehydrogenase
VTRQDARPILVAGTWRPGRGPVVPSTYPADGSTVAVVATAEVSDVDEAVAGGLDAFRTSGWAQGPAHERARTLARAAALIEDRSEELAQLQRLDNGKPITEARALVASAAGTFRYVAAACETMEEEITPARGPYLSMSVYEPIGVVAAITPWNSPIASEAQKLAPALAAGNAVILKPAEATPLVALELGQMLLDAGVPPGLVSVLPGEGPTIGDALVRHPDVGKVSFTGGTATGKVIAHAAADKMMPVTLELGGKSPTVVFSDAEWDHSLAGVAFGIFGSAGQACIAGSRLFVERSIADRFVDDLVELSQRIPLGDPADPDIRIGPLISHDHRAGVAAYVRSAVADGGEVRTGGHPPHLPALSAGPYYEPTIITGLGADAKACREEIFGPVLIVLPFDNETDLVDQANDGEYGLAAGIWTTDFRRAWRVARALRAGTVWCNTYKQLSIATPFGGIGASGVGREKGRHGIREYMHQKGLYWGLDEEPLPWAGQLLR